MLSDLCEIIFIELPKFNNTYKDYNDKSLYKVSSYFCGKIYLFELIELILWQRCCYEMENDYWKYDEGKCSILEEKSLSGLL